MAAATKNKVNESTESSDLFADMSVEKEITVPMRGRGYDPDTLRIREELEKALEEGTARSFHNCSDEKKREMLSRKIRTAGTQLAGRPEIKVATRYDKASDKLYWGPAEVIEKLQKKS